MPFEEQVVSIFAGTQGFLDAVGTQDVVRYEAALLSHMRANHGDVLTAIRDSKDLKDDVRASLKSALEGFAKTFA
jgi:F-type H+-transporting ATPase subunit alpha